MAGIVNDGRTWSERIFKSYGLYKYLDQGFLWINPEKQSAYEKEINQAPLIEVVRFIYSERLKDIEQNGFRANQFDAIAVWCRGRSISQIKEEFFKFTESDMTVSYRVQCTCAVKSSEIELTLIAIAGDVFNLFDRVLLSKDNLEKQVLLDHAALSHDGYLRGVFDEAQYLNSIQNVLIKFIKCGIEEIKSSPSEQSQEIVDGYEEKIREFLPIEKINNREFIYQFWLFKMWNVKDVNVRKESLQTLMQSAQLSLEDREILPIYLDSNLIAFKRKIEQLPSSWAYKFKSWHAKESLLGDSCLSPDKNREASPLYLDRNANEYFKDDPLLSQISLNQILNFSREFVCPRLIIHLWERGQQSGHIVDQINLLPVDDQERRKIIYRLWQIIGYANEPESRSEDLRENFKGLNFIKECYQKGLFEEDDYKISIQYLLDRVLNFKRLIFKEREVVDPGYIKTFIKSFIPLNELSLACLRERLK